MKKVSLILFLLQGFGLIAYSQEKSSSVTIGKQVWMTENLSVDKFRNGDPIKHAKTDKEWKMAGENKQPAWCYYSNNPKNGVSYGKLYNWYAVNDSRGLAPKGWHIPTDDEWTALTDYLGGEEKAGDKMKSEKGWDKYQPLDSLGEPIGMPIQGNGTNTCGFSGLPGGNRYINGSFFYIGEYGNWWSSSEGGTGDAWYRNLNGGNGNVGRNDNFKVLGLSVRCLRD
ncbi:MAG: fibrobacter succinogenes major paralogous domain-containing protein [Bacteroidota bacterium]